MRINMTCSVTESGVRPLGGISRKFFHVLMAGDRLRIPDDGGGIGIPTTVYRECFSDNPERQGDIEIRLRYKDIHGVIHVTRCGYSHFKNPYGGMLIFPSADPEHWRDEVVTDSTSSL